MLSTPISKVRSDPVDDEEDENDDDIEGFDEGDSDLSLDETQYARSPTMGGPALSYHDDDLDEARDYGGASGPLHPSQRAAVRPRARRRASRGPRTSSDTGTYSGYFGSPVWRAVVSRPFCQAVVLAFAIICVISLSPLASMAMSKVPALEKVPYMSTIIISLASAILVTATRPPSIF